MTREKKIEALAEEYATHDGMVSEWSKESFKAGLLAGIALRDAELLAMEFDLKTANNRADIEKNWNYKINSWDSFVEGARWQFEQFMKILKGDRDDRTREG